MTHIRLIAVEDLPDSLWDKINSRLILAPSLVNAWSRMLSDAGLSEMAMQPVPEDVVGGVDKKATDEHLAWRFSGSCARIQLAMLDPRSHLPEVTDAFARVFSGGTVLMTDVPCGSGAAAMSILSTVAELRKRGCVPRQPLYVKLIGGELSNFARAYADNGLKQIMSSLNEQAIWVEAEFHSWDALCKFSTADLIKRTTLIGNNCSARALILANFSDFLSSSGKWKNAAPQFESLFVHSRDKQSVAIWIEPQTNGVLNENGGFFSRLLKWFGLNFANQIKPDDASQYVTGVPNLTSADTQHPLRIEQKFRVRLAVKRFDLCNAGVSE